MRKVVIVHYDEIALKGGARSWFEQQLARAIREAMRASPDVTVERLPGRMLVEPTGDEDAAGIARRIATLPGVAYVLEGYETGTGLDDLRAAVDACLAGVSVRSFGVRARRSDKRYPLKSEEIGRELGAHVVSRTGWAVDLESPELWFAVEILHGRALVGASRHDGPGGLPVGSSGRGVALLSGGIDSPVAAWMMMTRGLRLTLVHFHSAPYTSTASQQKVRDLARVLGRYHSRLRLVMVPFADTVQREIVERADQRLRVVLYRRFMLRIAERIASEVDAHCIVTGEALGQVASQTLENMATVQAAATLPVLRPLVGMGKGRITELARSIGTYEVSIRPHEDCCTYLMPERPATRTTADELAEEEEVFDVASLVTRAFEARSEERLDSAGTEA